MTLQGHAPAAGAGLPNLGNVRQTAGDCAAGGRRFGIVVSRFNERLTRQLVEGAIAAIRSCGAAEADLEVVWVPGAFEIPTALDRLAASGRFHALIALGCVIQGETPHAALINTTVAQSLNAIARGRGIPVIDTVIPAMTEEQAEVRCRPGREGRGWYAGMTAVEMASLMARLPEPRS